MAEFDPRADLDAHGGHDRDLKADRADLRADNHDFRMNPGQPHPVPMTASSTTAAKATTTANNGKVQMRLRHRCSPM